MVSLTNRVAVVTGSGRGIGKAIALKFAHAGASIVVTDTDSAGIEQTVREIETLGKKAVGVKCNVANAAEVDELTGKVQEVYPTIDILVNNAGITRDNLLIRMGEEEWDLVLDVNLKGPFLVTKGIARIMMKQRYGRIINVSSVVGLMGNAGQANYASSKGGLIAFTRSVAKELGSRNITCNAVAPGFIETPMTEKLNDEVREGYLKSIPLKRMGISEDVANAVLFLSSDEAGYITGQVISVDGGLFMG